MTLKDPKLLEIKQPDQNSRSHQICQNFNFPAKLMYLSCQLQPSKTPQRALKELPRLDLDSALATVHQISTGDSPARPGLWHLGGILASQAEIEGEHDSESKYLPELGS